MKKISTDASPPVNLTNTPLALLLSVSNQKLSASLLELYKLSPAFPLAPKNPNNLLKKPYALSDHSLYIGEIRENLPHGIGYKLDPNGFYYEGNFSEGNFSGSGRLFTPKQQMITGMWVEGDISFGKIQTSDGKTYEGDINELMPWGKGSEKTDRYEYNGGFFKGKKHGLGRLVRTDGKWYQGEFIMGKFEGKGKFRWKDKEYEGDWVDGKMHGLGVMVWDNGDVYEGNMQAGLKSGYGVLTTRNHKYSGLWVKGKEEGNGVIRMAGKVIKGIWAAGKMIETGERLEEDAGDGKIFIHEIKIPKNLKKQYKEIIKIWRELEKLECEELRLSIADSQWTVSESGAFFGDTGRTCKGILLSSSQIYEGWVTNGKKSGFGRLVNKYHEVYTGNFENGTKTGFGVLRKPRADYIGDWQDNKFHGKGVLITCTMVYDGDWVKGLQHGNGVLEYPGQRVYTGQFSNGIISGLGQIKYSNGTVIKADWEDGEIVNIISKTKSQIIEDIEDDDVYDATTKEMLQRLISISTL